MSTATDPRAPITLFTFFLELSRGLPVPSGSIHTSYVTRDDGWRGWSDADVARLLGDVDVSTVPAGSTAHTAMVVRHLAETEPAPLSRVEAAFDD
jgi:hypothetical protein